MFTNTDMTAWTVRCSETRPCWLKITRPSGIVGCPILHSTYEDGNCPFAKEKVTDIAYETIRLRGSE